MLRKIFFAALLAAIISNICVAAEDQPYFKVPMDVTGTGCPQGFTVTGEGGDTLTLMFDEYDAADPNDAAASGLTRSSCNFAVPIHMPAGSQLCQLTADWRGFSDGETELTRQYFFADQSESQIDRTNIFKEDGMDFTERDSLNPGAYTVPQQQERDIILRINSAVEAKSNDSYISVDTIDKALVFTLNWQACTPRTLTPVLWFLLRP
ncbi:MAG: DUF4360 domain-containing protein [Candidatus Electrothrix sp. EH2]|nr:DUF4360 domain-containing protein [Candidatus Electrothrix sp. EH2]